MSTHQKFDATDDRLFAAIDVVGRSGAKSFEFGYLHDDVPIAEADWWATALYKGTKITVEHHTDPASAAEALAVRILTGGMCNHCKKLVALTDEAGFAFFHATLLNGEPWDATIAAERGLCRWRREGRTWVRGCDNSQPGQRPADSNGSPLNRAERRELDRRRRRAR